MYNAEKPMKKTRGKHKKKHQISKGKKSTLTTERKKKNKQPIDQRLGEKRKKTLTGERKIKKPKFSGDRRNTNDKQTERKKKKASRSERRRRKKNKKSLHSQQKLGEDVRKKTTLLNGEGKIKKQKISRNRLNASEKSMRKKKHLERKTKGALKTNRNDDKDRTENKLNVYITGCKTRVKCKKAGGKCQKNQCSGSKKTVPSGCAGKGCYCCAPDGE
ncbi:hypothetical protein Pcinc_022689 [Petrolisthes cinctipes]|uniref:Uncharacterized protein n=1 Tax=Petrolisthes cinctipes TaxID=88211 RepID=A0AAE1FEA5_PETCI|nr:hypothetical protein Pcinc_022689 [Petrolisthes cinctipes]